ncbi:MAG TPA: hypothetical protein VHM19_21240, partial [Polyangiales bacterium]|nr:hypothetical protein [Polyangiales bacterium]
MRRCAARRLSSAFAAAALLLLASTARVRADADAGTKAATLPPGHEPTLSVTLNPPRTVLTGDEVHLRITADAVAGDDVTVAEQTFAPFEVAQKRVHTEPASGGKQRFVFEIDLLAFEPGDAKLAPVELRVVTKDGSVGSVKTPEAAYSVRSRLANEPNAQPKHETKAVTVVQDNWWPIYIGGGLLAAALIVVNTLLVQRWLRNRKKAVAPPPPPRPPWDVAVEKLAALKAQKQRMLEAGQGALFVDQLSDVAREYLGGRFGFDGLETTTDEMLFLLKHKSATLAFTQEVGQFLGRCDLVKFAK